jgi:hypothetical protein
MSKRSSSSPTRRNLRANRKKTEAPKFLSGWKEIANYLGKGVRTVQRYERLMGFPVRRPAGKTRAAVVATKAELDAWVAASPIRNALFLSRPERDCRASTAVDIKSGIAEMRRLGHQLTALRAEVTTSVRVLAESIQDLQGTMDAQRRPTIPIFSVRGLDSGLKGALDLLGADKDERKVS